MKILHTADWHIGKSLHQFDLENDLALFFDWMIELINEENIDVLLVAGDIFDQNNPSNESRKLYFELLKKLAEAKIQVVITGGNHDSISMLQASKEILGLLNITIIGGVPEVFENQIIELKNKNGKVEVICAAVPFLRDKDLRQFTSGESYQERINNIREGIVNHFVKCKTLIDEKYDDQFASIAMGHLYLQGATLSESERDIQIGNAAGVEAKKLEDLFEYVALGHIHQPKRYGGGNIRYCGSPIALSFSEKSQEKTVIIVDVKGKEVASRSVKIPIFRQLIYLEGSWDAIVDGIHKIELNYPLPPLIELNIHEEYGAMPNIQKSLSVLKEEGYNIVKFKLKPFHLERGLSELTETKKINELNPREVFMKKLEQAPYTAEDKTLLLQAYNELLEEINNQD